MKKMLLFVLLASVVGLFGRCTQTQYEYPFQNPKLSTEERVENLLSLLTLEEKVGMMMDVSKPVERLGIPAYDWWNEALHGVARAGLATVFPQAIGMAATWNEAGHQQTFDIISDEARAKYNQAQREGNTSRYYGLSFWTPNVNIFRDPRWGRGQETYGEDPFLTSRLGVAAVLGLQGNDKKYFKSHACAKHYAVHSGPEGNRHSYNAISSGRDLWETYLPAFDALIHEANVQEVMCAYNAFEGQPCCGNDILLTDILREKWGYTAMVVSDCWAINDFFQVGHHETHTDAAEASADAVLHGTDVECGSAYEALIQAVADGQITEEQINVSMRRVLRGWFELGMLDPEDLTPWAKLPYSIVASEKHRAKALQVARESMTLLKNSNGVLPLSKEIKKIAVIGANADDSTMLWGNYNGTPASTVTILEGIQAKLPNAEVVYERGADLVDPWVRTSLYDNFQSGEAKGMKVDFYNTTDFSGAPVTVINSEGINYNNAGAALAEGVNRENTSTRIAGTFKAPYTGQVVFSVRASDGYKLNINGRQALALTGRAASTPTEYALDVVAGQNYNVVLDHTQTGRRVSIEMQVYKKEPIEFSALVAKLTDVDAIVYVGGLSPRLEGEEMPVTAEGFESGDKISIDLPRVQRQLLADLKSTGKPVVFVLCTGSSLALEQDEKNYDALLCAWYGGEAAGTAVADVLFGDYNPAGRLPVTFYKTLAQLDNALAKTDDPARQGFENYDMTGRTYRYMTEAPLYPFGHGLSYSTFAYGDAKLDAQTITTGNGTHITIPVTNSSNIAGDEVVQVYVKRNNDPAAPMKALRAFKRVHIEPGKTQEITLQIDPASFEFYDAAADGLVAKPGSYTILYGGTSADAGQKSLSLTVQ